MGAAQESRKTATRALVVLAEALTLVEDPHSWTRKGYALDSRGQQVRVDDPSAKRFCAVGAVLRAEHKRTGTPMPVATDPAPEIDDLARAVAPAAPLHVSLALEALGLAAKREMQLAGLAVKRPPGSKLSLMHFPMLLALHRRGNHARAVSSLIRAIVIVGLMDLNSVGTVDTLESPLQEENDSLAWPGLM